MFWLSTHRKTWCSGKKTGVLEQTLGSNPSFFHLYLCDVCVSDSQFCCQFSGGSNDLRLLKRLNVITHVKQLIINNALRDSYSWNVNSVSFMGVEYIDFHYKICSWIFHMPCVTPELNLLEERNDVFNLLLWVSTVPGTNVFNNVYWINEMPIAEDAKLPDFSLYIFIILSLCP